MSSTSKPAPHRATFAVCSFYVRAPASDGQFTYEQISLGGSQHDGKLRTTHPPLPGDLILLSDTRTGKGGMFRVIERAWSHADWGSVIWPYTEILPTDGPRADIIVEADDGPFRNEAPSADEDDEDPE